MRKTLSIAAVIIMGLSALALSGCGKYTSSWSAVGYIHSNDSDSGYMNFYKFKGREVFTLRSDSAEKHIKYSGKLEKGNLKVYYDIGDEKKELFSLKEGETIEAVSEDLAEGKVYVIVETDGECANGILDFKIE